jgi:hypothetical protein
MPEENWTWGLFLFDFFQCSISGGVKMFFLGNLVALHFSTNFPIFHRLIFYFPVCASKAEIERDFCSGKLCGNKCS